MISKLLLLTNYYPYHKGEEYIESEIRHLSNSFDEVIVVPTMVSSNMKLTRKVPNNVTVVDLKVDTSKLGKFKMVQNQGVGILKQSKIRNRIAKDTNNLKQKLFDYYFEARSQYVYENLLRKLEKYGVNKDDKIVIYSYWFFITAAVGIKLKNDYFIKEPKLVSRAHGYDINKQANKLNFLPYRQYFIDNIDYIYPVSEMSVNYLKNNYERTSNVSCCYLGVNNKEKFIEEKGTDSNYLKIISCSTVRDLKRVDRIVNILSSLDIDYHWTHIGNGIDFAKIKKVASEKLQKDNYDLVGYVENKNIIQKYRDINPDIFINLSTSEGVPVSIMEAFSESIPVIATDVGGTSELVKDGVNGFLIQKDFQDEDVIRLLENFSKYESSKKESYRKNAHETWLSKFNAQKNYQDFAESLVKLIS